MIRHQTIPIPTTVPACSGPTVSGAASPRPPIPADDEQRVDDLHRLDVLLSEPEESFDRITHELARVFDVSGVAMSFLDHDTLYFKSALGLPPELEASRTEPREMAICSHVVGENEMIVVEDLLEDDRFRENPLVVDCGARFYAGAPLRAESGRAVGSLCVVDGRPREMTEREQDLLRLVAERLMAQVMLQVASRKLLERTKQIERDLEHAVQVQRHLLPPDLVEGETWRIRHLYQPYKHLGGDFLDVQRRPDGRWAIVVADVCGHGASAALTSSMIKTAFLRAAPGAETPADLLTALHRDLVEVVPPGRFATALAAFFDPHRRRIEIASAGHPYPLLVGASGAEAIPHDNEIPLLIDRDYEYAQVSTVELVPGDRLLLYTDGAFEAADPDGTHLGIAGLCGCARDAARLSPGDFLGGLLTCIGRHTRGRFLDDVALLSIESRERGALRE